MPVRFFYVDESHNDEKFCLSAIAIWDADWKECFALVKEHRAKLKVDHGIFIAKEIHARDLVSGRGRLCPDNLYVTKWQRSRIFLGLLKLIAQLPRVQVFNVCLEKKGEHDVEMKAWDRLLNRIETSLRKLDALEHKRYDDILNRIRPKLVPGEADFVQSRLKRLCFRAAIIADEGREREITRVLRKMGAFNHIPSMYGEWASGDRTQNIRTERIIEDPIFKPSERSHFIQLADCIAFALLKSEIPPTPNIEKYKINTMFTSAIGSICVKEACRHDHLGLGIVRK